MMPPVVGPRGGSENGSQEAWGPAIFVSGHFFSPNGRWNGGEKPYARTHETMGPVGSC